MARIVKQPVIGIYIFLFLSSITMAPNFPIVGDRLAFADFVMGFTILAAWAQGRPRQVEPRLRQVELFADILIALCTVSSLLALLVGGDPVRVFLFMAIYLYGYVVFKTIVRHVDDVEKFKMACLAWGLGAALVIVVGFLASTGIYKPAWTFDAKINRISATMKDSGQVASYIAPALLLYVYVATSQQIKPIYRIAAIGLCGMAVVVLLGTGSRISFVMLLFFVAYVGFVSLTGKRRISRAPVILFLAAVLIGGGSYVVSVWSDTSEEYGLLTTSPFERAIKMLSMQTRQGLGVPTSLLEQYGGTRYEEISTALEHFPESPMFGVGSGMFSQTFKTNEVHNSAFALLIENGLFAFLFFCLWWAAIVMLLIGCRRHARSSQLKFVYSLAIGVVLVFLLYQMTTNGLRQRPFWFVPALALCSARLLRTEEQPKPDTAGMVVAAAR
ncbi:hypothetical protein PC39_08279 [Salinisphaera sp. PC39]|uniref:O-antigen ligase family protein n=1 Tax=Salinisphaera sp. PC39 TaxID=1304156 RepID=UPI003341960B